MAILDACGTGLLRFRQQRRHAGHTHLPRPFFAAALASYLARLTHSDRSAVDLYGSLLEDWNSSRPRSTAALAQLADQTVDEATSAIGQTTTGVQRGVADVASPDKGWWDQLRDDYQKLMAGSQPTDPEPLKVATLDLHVQGLFNPFEYYIDIDPDAYARKKTPQSRFWKRFIKPVLQRWESYLTPAMDGQIPQHVHFMTRKEAVELAKNYNILVRGLEELLRPPEDGQPSFVYSEKVHEVFTDTMFKELIEVMEDTAAVKGFDKTTVQRMKHIWEIGFGRDQKAIRDMTIAEFLLNKELEKSDLISVADAQTTRMKTQRGHGYSRPSMITIYDRRIDNISFWWSEWRDFMFNQKRRYIPGDGGRTVMQQDEAEGKMTGYATTSVVSTVTAKAVTFSPEFEEVWYVDGHWKRRLRSVWMRCDGITNDGLSAQEILLCASEDKQIGQLLGIQKKDFLQQGALGEDESGREKKFDWEAFQQWAAGNRFRQGAAPPKADDVDVETSFQKVSSQNLERGHVYFSNGYRYSRYFESCYSRTGGKCQPDGTCASSHGGSDSVYCDNVTNACMCKKHFCAKHGRCEPDGTADLPPCETDTGGRCGIGACNEDRGAVCRNGKCVCALGCSVGGKCLLGNPRGWCRLGIPDVSGVACCPRRCQRCEATNCRQRNGTMDECCPGVILQGRMCDNATDTACVISARPQDYYSLSGLLREEEAANVGASILGLAIWDAIYVHMMTALLDAYTLQKTRLDVIEQVVSTRSSKVVGILEASYDRQDVIFLQGVRAYEWNRTLQSTLSIHFHVLRAVGWDASNPNEEASMILINKKVFAHERQVHDLTPWVLQTLIETDTEVYALMEKGAMFIVKVALYVGGEYILASIRLGSGTATVSVMKAICEALTRMSLGQVPFVVGINTGVGAGSLLEKWTVGEFEEQLWKVRPTLASPFFDSDLNHTSLGVENHRVRTLIQTKPSTATRLADVHAERESSQMPAHHVLYDSACFRAISSVEDNTGRLEYNRSGLLPSMDMPVANPILQVTLKPIPDCSQQSKKADGLTGDDLKKYETATVVGTVVALPIMILAGTLIPHV